MKLNTIRVISPLIKDVEISYFSLVTKTIYIRYEIATNLKNISMAKFLSIAQ